MKPKSFYKSKRWKAKRTKILRRDEYMCQECRRYGKSTPAVTVHHVLPIGQHPELRLVNQNLISLCYTHHEKMHDRSTGELLQLGEEWVDRVSPHLRDLGFEV